MGLGSSPLEESGRLHGRKRGQEEGFVRVPVPRVRNVGKLVFFDGAKSDREKLRVWKKEVLTPSSFPRDCICRPVAASLRAQRPGREGSEHSSGPEIFELASDAKRLRPSSWRLPSRRLESSGRGKREWGETSTAQGLAIISLSSTRPPPHQQ